MAQEKNYFRKREFYKGSSAISFSPVFDVYPEDKRGGDEHNFWYRFEPKEMFYYKDKAREIFLSCLTEEELYALVPFSESKAVSSSYFLLYFNHTGEILYLSYAIDKRDTCILTDQKLYDIYQAWKHTRLDMTKGKFDYYTKKKSDRPDLEYTSLPIRFYMDKP